MFSLGVAGYAWSRLRSHGVWKLRNETNALDFATRSAFCRRPGENCVTASASMMFTCFADDIDKLAALRWSSSLPLASVSSGNNQVAFEPERGKSGLG